MRHLIAIVLLIGAILPAGALRAMAAAPKPVNLSIASADVRTGKSLPGACYIILTASEEGCDENGDGQVEFKGVKVGLFTVTMTKAPLGYLPVGDFPIAVQEGDDQIFGAYVIAKSQGDGTFNIALRAIDQFSGKVLTGACFFLYGGSEEGCDENNDGKVDFKGVRAGTYLAIETQAPKGYDVPDEFWVDVSAKGPKIQSIFTPQASSPRGNPNVSIFSFDRKSGATLTGACFIINGGSEEGCDENNDGQVDFRGVAEGTYTVTETNAPAGYATVADFTIVVSPVSQREFAVEHTATSGGGQQTADVVDVSIVSRDAQTGERLAGACYVIIDYSNEGCDENGDGQVDFEDIPHGRYAVAETRAPDGYQVRTNLQFLFSTPLNGGRAVVYVDHQAASR